MNDHGERRLTCSLMNTLCSFSRPIVDLPCICLLLAARSASFLTASLCRTVMPKLTLPFVYSWPGWLSCLSVIVCYTP